MRIKTTVSVYEKRLFDEGGIRTISFVLFPRTYKQWGRYKVSALIETVAFVAGFLL